MNQLIFRVETEENFNQAEVAKLNEIINALITSGSLVGMKNGSSNIHFDNQGNFVGLQHSYWPWKRRK